MGECLFGNVAQLKSTQFREGGNGYDDIGCVAGLAGKYIRKITGQQNEEINSRGNIEVPK